MIITIGLFIVDFPTIELGEKRAELEDVKEDK